VGEKKLHKLRGEIPISLPDSCEWKSDLCISLGEICISLPGSTNGRKKYVNGREKHRILSSNWAGEEVIPVAFEGSRGDVE